MTRVEVMSPDRNLAKSIASENLTKPDILTCINGLLDKAGLSDENVAAQHLFLINQHQDLGVKTRAIDMYYKLKGKYVQEAPNDPNKEVFKEVLERIRGILPE